MPFLFFILLSFFASPATTEPLYHICGTTGNFTSNNNNNNNNTYSTNLKILLSNLSSAAPATGFATAATGATPNRIFGLTLCRGDTDSPACRACISTVTSDIMQLCPYNKEATIWYNYCQLRYSNLDFLNNLDITSNIITDTKNVSADQLLLYETVTPELIGNLSDLAVRNASRMFATGETMLAAGNIIYGLVQCARDILASDCLKCLKGTVDQINRYSLKGAMGGMALGNWCNMRYEPYKFYNGMSMLHFSSPQPGADSSNEEGTNKVGIILGALFAITLPVVIGVSIITAICKCFWRRRSKAKEPGEIIRKEIMKFESILFDLPTLKVATSNFSKLNKLGRGGFGSVYKGVLPNAQEIAVKRLSTGSSQGLDELKNELVLIAKLQHKNLVRLYGVCLEEQEKSLIYEYVPNKSLDTILFDPERSRQLDWVKRYKIIGGIARGLLYLHEDSQLKIIHRDLKASNILLDSDMNAKISDFGLARLFGGDETQRMTSHIVGT